MRSMKKFPSLVMLVFVVAPLVAACGEIGSDPEPQNCGAECQFSCAGSPLPDCAEKCKKDNCAADAAADTATDAADTSY